MTATTIPSVRCSSDTCISQLSTCNMRSRPWRPHSCSSEVEPLCVGGCVCVCACASSPECCNIYAVQGTRSFLFPGHGRVTEFLDLAFTLEQTLWCWDMTPNNTTSSSFRSVDRCQNPRKSVHFLVVRFELSSHRCGSFVTPATVPCRLKSRVRLPSAIDPEKIGSNRCCVA